MSDICHGNGRTIVDGSMVPTGACKSMLNKKGSEIVDLDGANDLHYKCAIRDTVYIRKPTPVNQDLLQNRIQGKEDLGDLNKSGSVPLVTVPLAEDTTSAFIQTTSNSAFNKIESKNHLHNKNKSTRYKQT